MAVSSVCGDSMTERPVFVSDTMRDPTYDEPIDYLNDEVEYSTSRPDTCVSGHCACGCGCDWRCYQSLWRGLDG